MDTFKFIIFLIGLVIICSDIHLTKKGFLDRRYALNFGLLLLGIGIIALSIFI